MTNIEKNLMATRSDLEIVHSCIAKGEFKEALGALDHLTQTYPNDPNLFFMGGNCYGGLGHLDQAILCYQEAIKIKPDFAEAFNNMGFCLKDKIEITNAISSFKKAIKIKPDLAEAHDNLGICMYDLGKTHEALLCHKTAIKIKPDLAEAHNNLGNTFKALNQVDKSILEYKRAIKIKPEFHGAVNNLKSLLVEMGSHDELKEINNKMPEKNKTYEKAFSMVDKKNFTEAIKYFESAQVGDWEERILYCLYKLESYDEFKQKLESLAKQKNFSPLLATLSTHYAQNFKTKDLYNFCPSSLSFVSHEEVPELIENNQILIKELVNDINNANILKRQHEPLFDNSETEQSAGDLFKRPEQSFHKLSNALKNAIKRYYLRHQHEENEFIRSFPKNIIFTSAWYVKMQSGGHLTSHIHEDGWISGAVYLAIPKDNGPDGQEGAIELSTDGNGYPRLHDEFEKKIILPKEGEVIFFPSSIFHRTIPFNSKEERVCIAFDIKPDFS